MANSRNITAIKNSINNYEAAYAVYKKIVDDYDSLDTGTNFRIEFLIDKIMDETTELNRHIKKINVDVLRQNYPADTVKIVEKNIDTFKETIWYTQRAVLGKKLYDSAIYNVEVLINRAKMEPYEYVDYAPDEKLLAKKVTSILTDPKNVMDYKTVLGRISNGKFSTNEFKTLYDSIKHMIVPSKANEGLVGLEEFKKQSNDELQN